MKKIAVLTLFIGLLGTFVAYRAGIFDTERAEVVEKTEALTDEDVLDTADQLPTNPVLEEVQKQEASGVASAEKPEKEVSQPVIEELSEEQIRMYSSKSAPPFTPSDFKESDDINPLIYSTKSAKPFSADDFRQILKQNDVEPRMSSSKSLIIATPSDFDSMLYNPWNKDSLQNKK